MEITEAYAAKVRRECGKYVGLECDYLSEFFAARPNASRYGTLKALRQRSCQDPYLEEAIHDWQFNRKADAWELVHGEFVWYEIDGTNMTTCEKVVELSNIADHFGPSYQLEDGRYFSLNLFIYDIKANTSYLWSTADLCRLWGELEPMLDTGMLVARDQVPKTIPCTARGFGLDFSLLRKLMVPAPEGLFP